MVKYSENFPNVMRDAGGNIREFMFKTGASLPAVYKWLREHKTLKIAKLEGDIQRAKDEIRTLEQSI